CTGCYRRGCRDAPAQRRQFCARRGVRPACRAGGAEIGVVVRGEGGRPMTGKAVHFGAGNIGRGSVGAALAEGGDEIRCLDVAADVVAEVEEAGSYIVHEVGEGCRDIVVTGFSAVNSAEDPERVARELASADLVTCAVGPTVLKFIAPHVLAGVRARPSDA